MGGIMTISNNEEVNGGILRQTRLSSPDLSVRSDNFRAEAICHERPGIRASGAGEIDSTPAGKPTVVPAAQIRQLESVTQALLAMVLLDFSVPIPDRGTGDLLDDLAHAAQMLQRELSTEAVSTGHMWSLLEVVPNPVAVLDLEGSLVVLNEPMMTLLGSHMVRDDRCDFMKWVREHRHGDDDLVLSARPGTVQVRCRLDDGEHHYEIATAPIVSHFDAPDSYVAVATDITHQIEIERKLQHAEELDRANALARSRFLANMSHEIRTPLHGILGAAELLLSSLDDADGREPHEHAQTIQECGHHLLSLVNTILDFSQIESETFRLDTQTLDLIELLRECMDGTARSMAKDHVAARILAPAGMPQVVVGDGKRLRQIVVNLLENAFKFTSKGQVDLSVELLEQRRDDIDVRVAVSDTGIGIAADRLERILAPFEQLDPSSTRQYGGVGMGLTIVRHLVSLMDGQFGVDSTPGEGTTFWFSVTLPIATPALIARRPRSGIHDLPPIDGPLLAGCRVLLVEDNVLNQRIATRMLEQAGCTVTVAGNGREGLDLLAESPFDVVLMDCQMPVMDGITATRELRRRETDGHIPVIALTADALESHRDRCLEAGMDAYLSKPVRRDRLCATIWEHVYR